jgi:hypothetical protein
VRLPLPLLLFFFCPAVSSSGLPVLQVVVPPPLDAVVSRPSFSFAFILSSPSPSSLFFSLPSQKNNGAFLIIIQKKLCVLFFSFGSPFALFFAGAFFFLFFFLPLFLTAFFFSGSYSLFRALFFKLSFLCRLHFCFLLSLFFFKYQRVASSYDTCFSHSSLLFLFCLFVSCFFFYRRTWASSRSFIYLNIYLTANGYTHVSLLIPRL